MKTCTKLIKTQLKICLSRSQTEPLSLWQGPFFNSDYMTSCHWTLLHMEKAPDCIECGSLPA